MHTANMCCHGRVKAAQKEQQQQNYPEPVVPGVGVLEQAAHAQAPACGALCLRLSMCRGPSAAVLQPWVWYNS